MIITTIVGRRLSCDKATVLGLLQVCQTTYVYGTPGHYKIEVSKGCVPSAACTTLNKANKETCHNGNEPSCTYCCSGPLCNFATPIPNLRT